MIAYSYVRWSSDKQTQGDSFNRQTRIARELCTEYGWQLDQSLRNDSGVSAFTGQNAKSGALGDFLQSVSTKKIPTPCVLVVEAMDRLSRQGITSSIDLIQNLLKLDVTICIANPRQILNKSSLNNFTEFLMILASVDQANKYSEALSNRLRSSWKAKKEKARQGVVMTRKLPAWISLPAGGKYTKDFIINTRNAKIVKHIFSKYLSGMGVPRIAIELTKKNVPPFGSAKVWNTTTIFRILKSKTVIGHYQPQEHSKTNRSIRNDQGELIEGYYPEIISVEEFYRVQDQIEKRTIPRGPKKNRHSIFSGLLKCALCGGNMAMNTSATSIYKANPHRVILCSNAKRGASCNGSTIPYVFFEEIMLQVLFMTLLQATDSSESPAVKIQAIEGQIAALDKKIENLLIAIESAVDGHAIITRKIDALAKTKDSFVKKRDNLKNSSSITFNRELIANWQPLEPSVENREKISHILSTFIHRININPITQTAYIIFRRSESDVINEVRWDKKNRTSFTVNGITILKGTSQIWLSNLRIIKQKDLRPINDRGEPAKDRIRDQYRVAIQTKGRRLTYKCLDLGTHLEYWELQPWGKRKEIKGFTCVKDSNENSN